MATGTNSLNWVKVLSEGIKERDKVRIKAFNDCFTNEGGDMGTGEEWRYIDGVTTFTGCATVSGSNLNDTQYVWTEEGLFSLDEWAKTQQKEGNMETLWDVVLVTKDRDIEEMGSVVAEDEETARFEFAEEIQRFLRNNKLKLKDVTILCVDLGQVKVREEAKKVQVVDNG